MGELELQSFQDQLTRRLLAWSAFSIASGLALGTHSQRFWQSVGVQFAGWGLVDGLIALAGRTLSRRQPADSQTTERQARNLARLLWINTGLDVLYVLGGLRLVRGRGKEDRAWRGHGWGIIIQGSFLFFFDLLHARALSGRR